MGTFSAILGTKQCRPGNILLGARPTTAPMMATATVAGEAFITASPLFVDLIDCTVRGMSVFFIDPTRVQLISFFGPSAVPAGLRATAVVPPKATPGRPPTHSAVGTPSGPRGTHTGGVPNKG